MRHEYCRVFVVTHTAFCEAQHGIDNDWDSMIVFAMSARRADLSMYSIHFIRRTILTSFDTRQILNQELYGFMMPSLDDHDKASYEVTALV